MKEASAKTGTWDGPAPRGLGTSENRERLGSHNQASSSQRSFVLLPGGAQLPLIGFGTDKIKSANIFRSALKAGYRHFDCAAKYGNEKLVGEGLRAFIEEQGRDKLFITSKVWNDNHRPELVRQSCEQSIADLGCSYLDLLLVHWPDAWLPGTEEPDKTVTIEQTWRAMEQLVSEGKVRNLGVSNFSLPQVEALLGFARQKPVVNQVELHPLLAQRKLVGTCLRKKNFKAHGSGEPAGVSRPLPKARLFEQGVMSVAYSPLGHGTSLLFELPDVTAIARETGKSPAQVLLRWNVQRGVAVIPRSQTEANIRANIDSLFSWELTPAQKARLDALDAGKRTVDKPWHDWGDPSLGGVERTGVAL